MDIVDSVVVLRGVPLERDASITRSTLHLIEDALRKALGDEQVVPEWKCGVDGSSSLPCRSHCSIGVRIGVDRSDADNTVGGKHTAGAASAIEADGPGRCVRIVEIVVFCGR